MPSPLPSALQLRPHMCSHRCARHDGRKSKQRGAAETLYPEIRTIYVSEDAQTGIATYMDKERPTYKGR